MTTVDSTINICKEVTKKYNLLIQSSKVINIMIREQQPWMVATVELDLCKHSPYVLSNRTLKNDGYYKERIKNQCVKCKQNLKPDSKYYLCMLCLLPCLCYDCL